MDTEETKPELTTEQKVQKGVTGAMDVLVLVNAVLIAKKLTVAGLKAWKAR
jgi:hypothetical protein